MCKGREHRVCRQCKRRENFRLLIHHAMPFQLLTSAVSFLLPRPFLCSAGWLVTILTICFSIYPIPFTLLSYYPHPITIYHCLITIYQFPASMYAEAWIHLLCISLVFEPSRCCPPEFQNPCCRADQTCCIVPR